MNPGKNSSKVEPPNIRVVKDLVVNDAQAEAVKCGGTGRAAVLEGQQCLVFFLGG